MKNIVIFAILAVVFSGCQGSHCIKFGGTIPGEYTGDGENIPVSGEWCWDYGESKQARATVLKTEDGKLAYVLPAKTIESINLQIAGENRGGVAASTLTKHAEIRKLLQRLQRK